MQKTGKFKGFPFGSTLFGLVSYNEPWLLLEPNFVERLQSKSRMRCCTISKPWRWTWDKRWGKPGLNDEVAEWVGKEEGLIFAHLRWFEGRKTSLQHFAYKAWWISMELLFFPKVAEALILSTSHVCQKFAGPAIERSNQTAATEHQAGGDDGFLGSSFLEDHPTKQVVSHNLLTIVTTVTTC